MKLFLKISILISILGTIMLNVTCKKNIEISYSGIVYDSLRAKVRKPVSGVVVGVYTCDGSTDGNLLCKGNFTEIGEATTDATGHFSIQKTEKSRANWDVVYLVIPGTIYSKYTTGYYKKDLPKELFMTFN